jgi:hypothetical protein
LIEVTSLADIRQLRLEKAQAMHAELTAYETEQDEVLRQVRRIMLLQNYKNYQILLTQLDTVEKQIILRDGINIPQLQDDGSFTPHIQHYNRKKE